MPRLRDGRGDLLEHLHELVAGGGDEGVRTVRRAILQKILARGIDAIGGEEADREDLDRRGIARRVGRRFGIGAGGGERSVQKIACRVGPSWCRAGPPADSRNRCRPSCWHRTALYCVYPSPVCPNQSSMPSVRRMITLWFHRLRLRIDVAIGLRRLLAAGRRGVARRRRTDRSARSRAQRHMKPVASTVSPIGPIALIEAVVTDWVAFSGCRAPVAAAGVRAGGLARDVVLVRGRGDRLGVLAELGLTVAAAGCRLVGCGKRVAGDAGACLVADVIVECQDVGIRTIGVVVRLVGPEERREQGVGRAGIGFVSVAV